MTRQSASITSCWRRALNDAPMPKRVSRSSASRQPALLPGQRRQREIEHRQLHAARDVHADGVRDDRVARGQDTADRQTVADVGVRHQRARDRDRQLARVAQLLQRVGLEVLAPDHVRRIVLAGHEALFVRHVLLHQARELAVDGIGGGRLRRRRDPAKRVGHVAHVALGVLRVLEQLLGDVDRLPPRDAHPQQIRVFMVVGKRKRGARERANASAPPRERS